MSDVVTRYKKESTKLFDEWKDRHRNYGYKSFVEDGIVEPEVWFRETNRMLIILKEAYNTMEGLDTDTSLVEDLRKKENCKGRIWSTIAEWQYGLAQTTKYEIPAYDDFLGLNIEEHSYENYRKRRSEILTKCAVINVKKSNGLNGSNDLDLRKHVNEDADLLKRQIEIINPTIIVCGNTFHLLKDEKGESRGIFGCDTSNIYRDKGCYCVNGKSLIAYYHPANQYPALLNFYGIVGMYHRYLKEMDNEV